LRRFFGDRYVYLDMSDDKVTATQPEKTAPVRDKGQQRQVGTIEAVDHFLSYRVFPDASLFRTNMPDLQSMKDVCHVVLDSTVRRYRMQVHSVRQLRANLDEETSG
jgi:hypothetical protein